MTFRRELPVSGIKLHVLVMDDTKKDDIPKGAASFRYLSHIPVMVNTEKDEILEGAATFRYQATYSSDGRQGEGPQSSGSCKFQVSNHIS
jgi:hypothetical protein